MSLFLTFGNVNEKKPNTHARGFAWITVGSKQGALKSESDHILIHQSLMLFCN